MRFLLIVLMSIGFLACGGEYEESDVEVSAVKPNYDPESRDCNCDPLEGNLCPDVLSCEDACGNGTCEWWLNGRRETCSTCSADCGKCPGGGSNEPHRGGHKGGR